MRGSSLPGFTQKQHGLAKVSNMNNLDASIVALLKRNARMSVTQMSHELGVSRVTIDPTSRRWKALA